MHIAHHIHSARVRAKRSMDSKIHRFARRAQLRAQRRKQYKSWQLALRSQFDSSTFTARYSQFHQCHSPHCTSDATTTTSNATNANAEAGEVGEPLMHTQSPKALVTLFPTIDSPTSPKEMHRSNTHSQRHTSTHNTRQRPTSTASSQTSNHTTPNSAHARHTTTS